MRLPQHLKPQAGIQPVLGSPCWLVCSHPATRSASHAVSSQGSPTRPSVGGRPCGNECPAPLGCWVPAGKACGVGSVCPCPCPAQLPPCQCPEAVPPTDTANRLVLPSLGLFPDSRGTVGGEASGVLSSLGPLAGRAGSPCWERRLGAGSARRASRSSWPGPPGRLGAPVGSAVPEEPVRPARAAALTGPAYRPSCRPRPRPARHPGRCLPPTR